MKTTLNRIKAYCLLGEDSWAKLLKHLGKTQADDSPPTIREVLTSNGLDDALRCLRAVQGRDKEIRLLAVAFARRVQHLMTDARSLAALDVAERFANGLATREELVAARADAWKAEEAASGAAVRAAAAEVAAWSVAREAPAEAAADAAREAAWATGVAAWSVAREAAAEAGVWSTWEAAREDLRAEWSAAGKAERQAQTDLLLQLCARCEADDAHLQKYASIHDAHLQGAAS